MFPKRCSDVLILVLPGHRQSAPISRESDQVLTKEVVSQVSCSGHAELTHFKDLYDHEENEERKQRGKDRSWPRRKAWMREMQWYDILFQRVLGVSVE